MCKCVFVCVCVSVCVCVCVCVYTYNEFPTNLSCYFISVSKLFFIVLYIFRYVYSPGESKSEYALKSLGVWITEHIDLECSADREISIHLLNQSDEDIILNHLGFLSMVNNFFLF